MTSAECLSTDLAQAAANLRAKDEPFAFATIVRTAGATSARPGAKALIAGDGSILQGFLGGGCTQGAVRRAAMDAIAKGTPQLISIAPEDLLDQMGVSAGSEADGVIFARNGCPSRGTIDIFIEPCLPMPNLVVLGTSPVAEALSELAPSFHWSASRVIEETAQGAMCAIVVATQGQDDIGALRSALAVKADHIAFVGSKRKFATLAEKLSADGITKEQIERVSAPAGLNIGAVTPEEIALSILGELVMVRRKDVAEA